MQDSVMEQKRESGFISDSPISNRESLSEHERPHLKALINNFSRRFTNYGFELLPEVDITSGVDPTVRFIGSHISVMKQRLIDSNIPDPGIFMAQDCLRTQNTRQMFDDESFPMYGSFFTSMGALSNANPESINQLFQGTRDFLTEDLGIKPGEIIIHANQTDDDILNWINSTMADFSTRFNEHSENYYQHSIGEEHITGRNVNFAISNEDGNYADIGNIIFLENEEKLLAVELAIGDTTTYKQLYTLGHVLDSYSIFEGSNHNYADMTNLYKLLDCSMVALRLYEEDLRPGASNNQTRILRTYIKGLFYHSAKLGLEPNGISEMIESVASQLELGKDNVNEIVTDVIKYGESLQGQNPSNKEDKIIINGLGA